MADASQTRQLIRHFLRRFLENDLQSPDADRRDTLSMLIAVLICPVLFGTVLLGVKYAVGFHPPGVAALLALDDRFRYLAWTMAAMGLTAAGVWDALGLDARDAAALGTLPLPHRLLMRAKLAAVLVFGLGVLAAIAIVPTLIAPVLQCVSIPIGVLALLRLMAVHAIATAAAGSFMFFSVVALRELLRIALGARGFSRISASVQAGLVLLFACALFLIARLPTGAARTWLDVPVTSQASVTRGLPVFALPTAWFLGFYEIAAGDVIRDAPRVVKARREFHEWDRRTTAWHREHTPLFRRLGLDAAIALASAMLLGIGGVAWNARQLPQPIATTTTPRRHLRRFLGKLARRGLVPQPLSQAGFFFALQVLARSVPHRLIMAVSVALALTAATMFATRIETSTPGALSAAQTALAKTTVTPIGPSGQREESPWGLLAMQTAIVIVVMTGVRHAARVSADWRAAWIFPLAWSGDERLYLKGVKRAMAWGVGVPALVLLAPLHVWLLGPRVAALHALVGLLLVALLASLLRSGWRTLPFVSAHPIDSDVKKLAPLYLTGFLIAVTSFVSVEQFALRSTPRLAVLLAVLGLALVTLNALAERRSAEVDDGGLALDVTGGLESEGAGLRLTD